MKYTTFNSPIGQLTISTNGTHITSLHIEGDRHFTAIPKDWQKDPTEPLLVQATNELAEYFAGKCRQFSLPLTAQGTTFQQTVWAALAEIPFGATTTYGQIAKKIGRPKAVRAVGSAVGRNPIGLVVPCHRVVGSGGQLGGFAAGLERKQQLLQVEA